jgi:hypothetical protein
MKLTYIQRSESAGSQRCDDAVTFVPAIPNAALV